MQIRCVSCRKDIPAEDVNLDNALAKCRACHAVFDFRDQVKIATPIKKREPIPMPKNLVVTEGPRTLDIVRTWWRGPGWFFLVFAGFWNILIFPHLVVGIGSGTRPDPGIWLFMTPFILVGLGTGYVALAMLLNRTIIHVEGTELRVSHRPLPWWGAKQVDPTQMSQLYCSEYVAYKQNKRPQYRMKVHAVMRDGSRLDLLRGIEDAGQALYLEQLLEKHLGIEDRPVKGEYQGGHLD
jgi:hypothetical protein